MYSYPQPIAIVRGTTNSFSITVIDKETGQPYSLQSGEVLRFGVKKQLEDVECLFTKEIAQPNEADEYAFTINPSDTLELDFGSYYYDVGLQSGAAYYPVIETSPFELAANVTEWEG